MTITLKPIHLILISFLAGLLVAVIAVLALAVGDDGGNEEVPGLAQVAQSTPIGPDEPPTKTPEPPSPTERPPTETPPPPASTPEPIIRSCEEISATGDYLNPEERQFFLDNCVTSDAPSQPPPPEASQEPSSTSSGATAQEGLYRDRAEGNLNIFAIKVGQYFNTPALGGLGDILEIGAVMRRQAQDLDRLPEPPPRFKQVHDQFQASLISFADFIITVVDLDVFDVQDVEVWIDAYFDGLDLICGAMEDFALVVGIELPPICSP